jgi:hypothetical protein
MDRFAIADWVSQSSSMGPRIHHVQDPKNPPYMYYVMSTSASTDSRVTFRGGKVFGLITSCLFRPPLRNGTFGGNDAS